MRCANISRAGKQAVQREARREEREERETKAKTHGGKGVGGIRRKTVEVDKEEGMGESRQTNAWEARVVN